MWVFVLVEAVSEGTEGPIAHDGDGGYRSKEEELQWLASPNAQHKERGNVR